MDTITLDEAKQAGDLIKSGQKVALVDQEGRVRIGAVRIKEIKCGKKSCTKCPHRKYAYVQYRVDDKVKEKYLGRARYA